MEVNLSLLRVCSKACLFHPEGFSLHFDFKQVEMNEFSVPPNVKVIKDEHEASMLLEGLVKEMDIRYKFSKKGRKENQS